MATNIPITGKFKVTCEFGRKGKVWSKGWHTGIDLIGQDDIYSPCDGIVYKTGYSPNDFGNYIVIKEGNLYHWLCHLSKISCVIGQSVSREKIVGVMGSTGKSTAKHLHYEIRKNNSWEGHINPADYMGIPNQVGEYDSANYQINDNPPAVDTFTVRVDKNICAVRSQPTSNSPKAGSQNLYKGNTFQTIGTVVGEDPFKDGNNIWYKSEKGNFVWSGGLTKI